MSSEKKVEIEEEEGSSKKRPRSDESDPTASAELNGSASVSASSAAAAAQLSATMGWNGLYAILSASALTSTTSLPTVAQVQQAAEKCVTDSPPYVHLSKTDTAPQLKMDSLRLQVKGGTRGYRMSRGSHGISQGNYYYEVLIQEPPKASEIASQFQPNMRLNPKLQKEMEEALQLEREGKPADPSAGFGAHVRLGFANRTADLSAPVGYDKWSYGIRDIGGSKIHASQREDNWGGESFGPGDVIGCAISLQKEDQTEEPSFIRFFKNGQPLGTSDHKKDIPMAFTIPSGVYYPAVSLYMGGVVQMNFGPHFVYPPKKSSPKFRPVSDLAERPMSVEDAVAKAQKEKVMRKVDMQKKFLALVTTEVEVLHHSYSGYRKHHIQMVLQERVKRQLKTDDLEGDEFTEKE
jgi:Set1/Ash2 histone methyltransferase complex subunit ASH2